ncbi:unnamed protein product [Oreochromis niloticus]|nr:unnamed protein product [Mustela putorius furo]
MVSTRALSLLLVALLFSVQVVQNKADWGVTYTTAKICASNGSTVEMKCTYTYPAGYTVKEEFWCFQDDKDLKGNLDYKDRIQYNCTEKSCTMKMADLKWTDSREYRFRFITDKTEGKYTGVPGITLSITALQVEVTKIRVNESCTKAELKCKSSCTGDVSYVWLKNGKEVTEENPYITSLQFNDSICCALKGQGKYCSASLYAPKLPSVSVSPSAEIVEGSSVTLTCSSDANPAANYTWYKEGGQTPLSITKQLSFPSIQSSDSGVYNCTAENELGIRKSKHLLINVKYAPKLPSVSVSPSAEIVEGSSVTLTCSSDANPAANYTWYKEGLFLAWAPDGVHHFTSISPENRGNYSCKSENQYGQINSSPVFINVQYPPKLPSVSVSPSAEIVEGRSVTLTCSSDANPAASYTWYKEDEPLPVGPEGVHHFTSISSEDRGNYFCKSENQYGQINSSPVFINVQYAPKLPSVSVSPSAEIVEGSSVTLTCSSDANPAANYIWYKEDEDSAKASGHNFIIDKFSPAHSGAYQCKVQNNRGFHSLTFLLAVVRLSGNDTEMWKVIAGTAIAILLVVVLIWILFSIWKKEIPRKLPEPTKSPGTSAQKQPVEQNCNLQYASIQFSKKQTDPLYSNIKSKKHKEEEEESKIQYAAVKVASVAPSNRNQETEEDPATLYSSINKALQKYMNQN